MTVQRASYVAYFSFWLIFAMCSSFRDWDLGYTLMEIDIRALMENFSLPSWSYQYCGGITRSGDVNSLAESPWFILFLVFGSYWGVKLLAPVAMTISAYFLNRYLQRNLHLSFGQSFMFSILFGLNGFWLLHFVHGHVGYSSQFLFIVSCLYFYDYFLRGEKRELFVASLLYFLSFTMGFYQVGTYMGFPAFLSVALTLVFLCFTGRVSEINWNRLFKISLAVTIVSLLYSHKIYSSLTYQRMFPRVTGASLESYGLSQLFYSLFIPAKDALNAFEVFKFNERWLIHEFGYFSLLNLTGVLGLIWFVFKKKLPTRKDVSLSAVIAFFGIFISILFYLGNFCEFSPFGLLNKFIFNNSHRVSPRYLLWGEFFISLGAYAWMVKTLSGRRLVAVCAAVIVVSFLQIFLIFSEPGQFDEAMMEYKVNTEESLYSPEMKFVSLTTFEYPRATYFLLNKNLAVLNCYTPLNHPMSFDFKFLNNRPMLFYPYFFLSYADGAEIGKQTECFTKSYFTQTEIHIDDSCPDKLRLRLADINPQKPIKNYASLVTPEGILLDKKSHSTIQERP